MLSQMQPWAEPLEERQLLSASISGTTLRIIGTSGNDRITVRQTDTSLIVVDNGRTRSFALSRVSRIQVYSGNGDDRVDLWRARRRSLIDGGENEDTILGTSANDFLFGGHGGDQMWGGLGNDRLEGAGGTDILFGGPGDDSLIGGRDVDALFGEAGNDFIDAQDEDWEDVIVGGAGFDEAEIDDDEFIEDPVLEVEDAHD